VFSAEAMLTPRRRPSDFVLSDEGMQTQKKLWRELMAKLEAIHPGIMQNL